MICESTILLLDAERVVSALRVSRPQSTIRDCQNCGEEVIRISKI